MAAYRRVYDSRHLQAGCQEPGSAPEPIQQSSTVYPYPYTLLAARDRIATALLRLTLSMSTARTRLCMPKYVPKVVRFRGRSGPPTWFLGPTRVHNLMDGSHGTRTSTSLSVLCASRSCPTDRHTHREVVQKAQLSSRDRAMRRVS